MINILLLGSGGREHAFAWLLKQSKQTNQLYVAPGNAGTAAIAQNVSLDYRDKESIKDFIRKNQIEMVVVGPEQPLVDGLYDVFQEDEYLRKILFIGPSKQGARLEGSKHFAKTFMQKYHIPTAKYQTFTKETVQEGMAFLKSLQPPYVLKADGLAAGKGVVIAQQLDEAVEVLMDMLCHAKFGEASAQVVIEEFLQGIECSVFVMTDGESYHILPYAKDYKRIGDGDQGLNTGGMGAVSPVPFADEAFMEKVEKQIVQPTLAGLQKEQIPYQGFIFIGLMNVGGNPYVIEYNVRMGDPETEAVFPRIKTDFVDLLTAVGNRQLKQISLDIDPRFAACVMMVAQGYPENYRKGDAISQVEKTADCLVFHAGTALDANGQVITQGGRVIAVTALGDTIQQALDKAYKNVDVIQYEGKYFRKDIGKDLL